MKVETEHPIDYLTKSNTENWSDCPNPLTWVLRHTKRNKIDCEFYYRPIDNFVDGKTEPYIVLTFKSERQFKYFLNKANQLFPYVEFI